MLPGETAQTLVDMGVSELFQELEEVPRMTMVGGLDVHPHQITFDYVDNDGLVHWGQFRPATRKTLRGWLAEHCPDRDAEFALEGCTGWRYVCEELAAAGLGVHLGIRPKSPRRAARRSWPRPIAPMLGCCARCCCRAGSRSRGSRPHTFWRSAAWAGCTAR